MKFYNYLAFSIYHIFKKTTKRDDHFMLVFKTSNALSLLIIFVIYTIKIICELNGYNDEIISNFYIFIFIIIIGIPNYLYLRKEKFLDYDFSFNYKNIIYTLLLIFFIGGTFLFVANKNRERIFKKRGYSQKIIDNGGVEPFEPNKKPQSLEGDIKLWYYNTFQKKDSIK